MKENTLRKKIGMIGLSVCVMAAMLIAPAGVYAKDKSEGAAVNKDETVYLITKADGTPEKTIVSDYLDNENGFASLIDKSNLTNIENVKGNESFKKSGTDQLRWNTAGKSIYYQGKTTKSAPITMNIKYYINGNQVQPENLAGKSGNLKIKIDYNNNERVGDVYVPFLVASTLILKDDNFSNVKIDNGKVIDDGDKQIVAGIAMPGMTESLGISSSKLSIPESLQITAKVKKFSLDTIVTVAANNVFDTMDMSSVDSLKDLDSQVSKLDSAAKQLMSGSEKLAKGASSAYSGSKKIASGSKKLSSGMSSLYSGISKLNGKLPALETGISKIDLGLNGNGTTSNPGLKNGLASYTAGVDKAAAGANTAVETFTKLEDDYNSEATSGTDAQTAGKAKKAYAAAMDSLNDAIKSGDAAKITKAENDLNTAVTNLGNASAKLGGDKGAAEALQGVLNGDNDNGLNSLAKGMTALTKESGTLNSGASKLASGAAKLDDNAPALAGGVSKLKTGSGKLSSGARTLASGSQSLMIGNKKLAAGSSTLNSGMKKFYSEGIEKIVEAYNGNVKGVVNRLQKMIDASQDYTTFTKLGNGTKGNVKFLYRTDAIGDDN